MTRPTYLTLHRLHPLTGLTIPQLFERKHAKYRYIAYYVLHDYLKMNQYELAKEFNTKQCCISWGISRCLDLMFKDEKYREVVEKMTKKIGKSTYPKNSTKQNLQ